MRNSYNFGSLGRTFGILFQSKRSELSILFGMARKKSGNAAVGTLLELDQVGIRLAQVGKKQAGAELGQAQLSLS